MRAGTESIRQADPGGDSPDVTENYNDVKHHYFHEKAGVRENSDLPHHYFVKRCPFPTAQLRLVMFQIIILRKATATQPIVMFHIVISRGPTRPAQPVG